MVDSTGIAHVVEHMTKGKWKETRLNATAAMLVRLRVRNKSAGADDAPVRYSTVSTP